MTSRTLPLCAARLRGIHKRFRDVVALRGADLVLRTGEVHGVLGENGAGKTTLLTVLGGGLRPDGGQVEVEGASVTFRSPRDAWAAGVGMVHQHYALVGRMTVADNLALGFRGTRRGSSDVEVRARALALEQRTGLSVPLDETVEVLGVGTRQRVEILKALLRDPSILILDEPTAALTPSEVERLFLLLRQLADQGTAVVMVAHKLDEVLSVSDRVTVLRSGRSVFTESTGRVRREDLVRAMVGREPPAAPRAAARTPGPRVVTLAGASLGRPRGGRALDDVNLSVHRGEILGIAGVEGNGQRELAWVLSGLQSLDNGTATLPGGIGFISQDRSSEGLVAQFDLAENMALALHRSGGRAGWGLMDWDGVRRRTREALERYDIRAPGTGTPAGALSGGNQQRLVVAREVAEAADLLVAENPTRGLDVAATAFVHSELLRLAQARGSDARGVVLISSDLDEVLALSDRIAVMVNGRLTPVPDGERTREGVGRLMLWGRNGEH